MKNICAIIPEKRLEAVNTALHKAGIRGLTIFDTKGRGKEIQEPNQMGHWLYFSEFGENNTIMILSDDANVSNIVNAIKQSAITGKIFVTDVEDVIDIKKDTDGEEAL